MSKKMMVSLGAIGFIIIVSIWAFITSLKISDEFKNTQVTIDKNQDEAVIEKPFITETKDGIKYWEIYADSGSYDSTKNGALLKNVKGNFYKQNKVVLSFEAPIGVYCQKTKEVRLKNGAKAATNSDVLITANEMYWVGKKNQITCSRNTKIHKLHQFATKSDSAIFNTDFSKFKIIGKSETYVLKK